jgi:hypothetical protein
VPFDNSFRASWGRLGYGTDHGSAATGEPPPKQYIRLYHICPLEHAQSNLENSRLKIACFDDLNDPFEFRAVAYGTRELRTAVKAFGANFGLSTGLLCFSEDWTSPVMWSHYGRSHRGVCLGFDVPRRAVRRVIYRSKRLQLQLADDEAPGAISPEIQRLLLRVKCREWAYERERRMYVPFNDAVEIGNLKFRRFDDRLVLREVILGPRCELTIDQARTLPAVNRGVHVFKARLAWNHFKVVPVESSVP